jgi:WD40 repeat protein
MRLGTLRNRASITGFGIEKDGTVVTVGPDMDVRRWNPADDKSEEPIRLPRKEPETSNLPPGGRVVSNNYPQVSPDGKFVAAISNEKGVCVWEAPTDPKAQPKEVAAFEIPRVRLFRFAPDSTKLVVTTQSSQGSTVHMCDIKTGKRTDLDCAPSSIKGVNFSGDGKRVGVSADADFYFLDAVTGKQLAKYRTDGQMSSTFALNHTGDVLAAPVSFSGPKSEFHFTDPLTGKKLDGLTGPEGPVYWLTFAPDGKTLLIGDRSAARWWDPTAAKLIRTFEGIAAASFGFQHNPARFSPDGKILVAHSDNALLRWNANTGKPLFPEQDIGHGGAVNGVGMSADGKRIATRGMDGRVCVWDATTGKALSHAPAVWSVTGSPTIDFSPDGKFLFISSERGEVAKLDAATGQVVTKYTTDPKGPKQGYADSVRVSKDGKTVFALTGPYSGRDVGFVTTWDANTGERKKVTELPVQLFTGELSPGAEYVFAGGLGSSRVFAVGGSKKNLLEETKLKGPFLSGHFSDDGKWYAQVRMERAAGGVTYSAAVISTLNWEVASTIPLAKVHRDAISPDGATLAVVDGEKLEFYDTRTTRSLGTVRVPADGWEKAVFGYTHVLRFTPDGTKLITGHADTTALVWPVPARPAK